MSGYPTFHVNGQQPPAYPSTQQYPYSSTSAATDVTGQAYNANSYQPAGQQWNTAAQSAGPSNALFVPQMYNAVQQTPGYGADQVAYASYGVPAPPVFSPGFAVASPNAAAINANLHHQYAINAPPEGAATNVDQVALAKALAVTPHDDKWGAASELSLSGQRAQDMLQDLHKGDWPVGLLIGARVKPFTHRLGKLFHEGNNITASRLGEVSRKYLSFSSVGGQELPSNNELMFFGLRFQARKLYFIMSRWGTVFVAEPADISSRDVHLTMPRWIDELVEVKAKSYVRLPDHPLAVNKRDRDVNPHLKQQEWTQLGVSNAGSWLFRLVPDAPTGPQTLAAQPHFGGQGGYQQPGFSGQGGYQQPGFNGQGGY